MVAVKKFPPTLDFYSLKDIINEARIGARLKHKNVVTILGYCMDIQKTLVEPNGENILCEEPTNLLVLDYLPNGSLQDIVDGMSSVKYVSSELDLLKLSPHLLK